MGRSDSPPSVSTRLNSSRADTTVSPVVCSPRSWASHRGPGSCRFRSPHPDLRWKRRNDSPNPLRSSLCLVISYRCICVFFCIAGTAYRSDLLCGKDVKDGGPCPPYENSFGPGLRTYVESGDCTNGLGESLPFLSSYFFPGKGMREWTLDRRPGKWIVNEKLPPRKCRAGPT